MKVRSRWAWGLGFAAVAVLGLTLARTDRSGLSLTIGDWKIRVLGASYGTEHFGPPQRWNRIKSAMPESLLRWVDLARPRPARFSAPQLVVWVEVRSGEVDSGTAGELHFKWRNAGGLRECPFRFLSDLEVAQASGWLDIGKDRQRRRHALVTRVYPRRDQELRLTVSCLDPTDGIRRFGELSFGNPRLQTHGRWKAEVLPASREAEGLTVELKRFELDSMAGAAPIWWAQAVVYIRREGVAVDGWGVEAVELADPTGNRVVCREESGGQDHLPLSTRGLEDGGVHLRFPWLGWKGEPVWEMSLQLRPTGMKALDSGDPSAVLIGIAVPSEEDLIALDREVLVGEAAVRVLGLAGAHSGFPGRARDVFGAVTLELEVPSLPAVWHLAVVTESPHGEVLPPGRLLGDQGETVILDVPGDVKSINLGLLLHPERRVRFRVGE